MIVSLILVIRNILSNAIKFTSSGGSVTAQAKSINGYVEIKISDTGIGIEKAKLESLFELKSSDSTKGSSGELGTGFGLVLCKQFVKENKGQISVESELGKGTIFTISFPEAKNI